MIKSIIAKVSYAMSALAAVGLSVLGFWTFSTPKEAITIKNLPVPVISDVVRSDSFLGLKYSYCKNVDANGKIRITLISDKQKIVLPDQIDKSEKACVDDITVPVPIPKETPPDTYHVHYTATYKVNPLREITQEWDSADFQVVE